MKKFNLIIVLAGILITNSIQAQISSTLSASQAEQIANQYFNHSQYLEELKSEYSLTNEFIHDGEQAYMNFVFKKRMNFIKGYLNGDYTIYNAENYFNDVKAIIKNHLEDLLANPNSQYNFGNQNTPMQLRGPGDPCTNPDFEMCNFTNWNLVYGGVNGSAPYSFVNATNTTSFSTVSSSTPQTGGSGFDQHYICTGGTDGIGGFPMVYPGGTCTAAIGDFTNTGNGASQIRQTFLVSSGNAILTLNYAVCLEDAGHSPAEQPYFRMRVYDQSNNSIGCAEYEAVAGDGQPGWATNGGWQYKPWTTVFIPMAPYIGQNVTVEFTVGDCSQGGHAGYAYVDASCTAMAFNMSAQSVCQGQPITISAPSGAASYLWNTGATTQTISTSTAGTYSVTVTPVTGSSCAITLDTTIQSYPNPIANFISNAPTCVGQPVTFTDQSNPNGSTISQWSWNFGDAGTSTLQNPTHTYTTAGNFTVSLTVTTTDGCTHTFTQNITINPNGNPTINPAGPFCGTAAPATITANVPGGTWSATCGACINAVSGQFDPSLANTGNNTITYTVTGACGGTDTEIILIENVSIDNIVTTNNPCFGNCVGTITVNASGATQYSNNGGTSFQPGNTFNALCVGNYNIVVQTPIGCQAIGAANITQPTQLNIPTSFNDEVCFGACDGDATVTPNGGTPGYSYLWSNGGTTATISNLCVGNYSVTVTDANNCTQNANITISGPPQVIITNVAEVDETCFNSCDGSITITSPLASQFSIDNGVTFQASGNFTNICSGNYNLVVTDAAGCPANGTANITTPNPINIVPDPDATICIGQSATVGATANGGTGTLTYIWDNSLPNGQTNTVTPAATTTYTVFAQDANGCTSPPVQITITLNPPLQVTAQSDQAICFGENATITASASGGNGGPYTYIWDDGAGNQLSGATQTVSPTVTTTYTVTASDNCGTPVANDAVTITVNPLPNVTFTADTLQGCTPVNVNFSNTTNPLLTGTCFWDFGDGTTSTNCNPNHVFTAPGCYPITLTVTSPDGCVSSLTQTNMICVFAYPIAEFSFGPQPTDILNTEINFVNETTGGVTYDWDFAGLGTSQQTHPTFTFPYDEPGNYNVCLSTVSIDGCFDSICHIVVINDLFLLYVPNTFTPDGDGINDYFFPVIDGYDPENFEMLIFNRWGELIFQASSPDQKWDGTYRSLMSKEDTYVWKINTKDVVTNKKRQFYGHVNLLR